MRFKLTLRIDKKAFGDLIPFNYSYECSAVIYKLLSKSNAEFSEWLHDNGFLAGQKQFKLFTFSRLQIPKFTVNGSFLTILSDTVEWYISFLPERSTQEFIQGLFREQEFEIGNRQAKIKCRVQGVEMMPTPSFSEQMSFETLSPVCIPFKRTDGTMEYIPPDNPQAISILQNNLLAKYRAMYGKEFPDADFPFNLHATSTPKSALIAIKQGTPEVSKLKGFMFRFEMTAPTELMKIMYEAGLGGKNSVGFGMVRVKD